jgi:hypothetical protein
MPLSDATGPGRGARSLYRAANAIGRCDSMRPGGTELKFEDRNKGPRRLLAGDEQDLGEGLRIELNRLVSLFASCRRGHRRTRPRFKRLRRVRRSISEFVTSRPATTISPAPFDGRTGGARPRSWRVVWTTCALRSCVFAMSRFRFAPRARHRRQSPSDPEHRRARPASVNWQRRSARRYCWSSVHGGDSHRHSDCRWPRRVQTLGDLKQRHYCSDDRSRSRLGTRRTNRQ